MREPKQKPKKSQKSRQEQEQQQESGYISKNNPAGPVDKTLEIKDIPGISDDTCVIFADEHNPDDG